MISTRLQFTRLTPAIGAIAGGIDLAQPLADEEVATIREALDDWLVLFFPISG